MDRQSARRHGLAGPAQMRRSSAHWLVQDVGVSQVLRSSSVISDSTGTKKSRTGQASSRSTTPSFGRGTVPDESVVIPVRLAKAAYGSPGVDTIADAARNVRAPQHAAPSLSAERGGAAGFPMLHAPADLREFGMLLDVIPHFARGLLNRLIDAAEPLPDLRRRATRARLAEPASGSCAAVQSARQGPSDSYA